MKHVVSDEVGEKLTEVTFYAKVRTTRTSEYVTITQATRLMDIQSGEVVRVTIEKV